MDWMSEIIKQYEYEEKRKRVNGTWSNVAVGASNGGHGLRGTWVVEELGKSEIGDMGFEVFVEQYIVGFDVSVNDERGTIMVQVAESSSSFHCNLEPHLPP